MGHCKQLGLNVLLYVRLLAGRNEPAVEHVNILALHVGHPPGIFAEQYPPPVSHDAHIFLPQIGVVKFIQLEQELQSNFWGTKQPDSTRHGSSQPLILIKLNIDCLHMGSFVSGILREQYS
jgi:hypothetical protein